LYDSAHARWNAISLPPSCAVNRYLRLKESPCAKRSTHMKTARQDLSKRAPGLPAPLVLVASPRLGPLMPRVARLFQGVRLLLLLRRQSLIDLGERRAADGGELADLFAFGRG
jgi:hypothetical protein